MKIVQPVLVSEDAIEGATAFAQKRAPNWKGK
jgi:enoyl-CoA hydratase